MSEWFRKQAHIQGEKAVSKAFRSFSMHTSMNSAHFVEPQAMMVLDLEHSEVAIEH